jgi:hypothetical protein
MNRRPEIINLTSDLWHLKQPDFGWILADFAQKKEADLHQPLFILTNKN